MFSNTKIRWTVTGLLFSILWASASTATKIGLTSAQPLIIAEVRFFLAAAIMLSIAHLMKKHRLPKRKEWKQLALYGLLNISIYLGCYVIAMKTVTAGIGTLAVASNPVFISFISAFFLKTKFQLSVLFSLLICTAGVVCAAWPLFQNASVSVNGLLILFFSMISYSIGAIYFSSVKWQLSLLTINGWQTLLGSLFLLPVTCFFYKNSANHYNTQYWLSVIWLAIPISIFAVQLWLWLLQLNAVRAGLWLFLCPLFGFAFAAWLTKDVISIYTVAGVLMVIIGLMLSKSKTKRAGMALD